MTYFHGPNISDNARQVIIGTVLGGSSIIRPKTGRSCYLSMQGSNISWLQCKAQELVEIASSNPYTEERLGYFRWHSRCCPTLNTFREMFYIDSCKKVNMEILDQLRNIGLAVWFLDSGKLLKGIVVIRVSPFGEEGSKIISQYFKEVSFCNEIIGNSIYFATEASAKFLDVVHPFIPQFMLLSLKEK